MSSVADYTSKITSEHRDQPDFLATVALSVQTFVEQQNILFGMPTAYDLDVAVGSQLDAVGLWVGRSRFVSVPLANVYFSWGTEGLGWGQGVWRGEFDPVEGLSKLDDDTYRLYLKTVIAANNWDGSIPGAAAALATLFNDSVTPGTKLWIQDNLDMTMTFIISGQIPPRVFSAILAEGLIPLKPVGVSASYVQTSVNGAPVFAWGMSNEYGAGWGTGAWAQSIA